MDKKILNILKKFTKQGYEAYIVGGFVRDKILNIDSFDIDICTNANPSEVKKIFPNSKYNDFFVSIVKDKKYNIEITTFRKDSNYDGRYPQKVQKVDNLIDDLKRRDFTINTICLDANGTYIDLFNGISDINNKIIRCVGDADKKLSEDSFRILRAIRFATTLNFKLDKFLEQSILKYAHNVSKLTVYRRRYELDKIFTHKNFKYGIDLLKRFNLDGQLNLNIPNNIKYCDNYIGVYAQIDVYIDNFFTAKELKQITVLKKYISKDLDLYDLFVLGNDNLKILNQIVDKDLLTLYEQLPIKTKKDLNLVYDDVKSILVLKNLKFSDIQNTIIKKIISGDIPNKRDVIIQYINNNY